MCWSGTATRVEDLFARRVRRRRFARPCTKRWTRRASCSSKGLPLAGMVDRRLALDIELFSRGGMRVLDKIEAQNYDVLSRAARHFERPSASGCCWARWRAWRSRGRRDDRARRIVRVLPRAWPAAAPRISTIRSSCCRREQRDAMCAIYAFMRYCDDLSDEPGAIARRHRALARRAGRGAGRPVRRPSGLAGVSRHRAALPHPARVFPRDDRRRDVRPGAAPHRDLRRAVPLLLSGGVGGRTDHDSHLRLRFARRPCRWPRSAASRSS